MQGRPKDGPEDKFRLAPIAPRLQELLGTPVNAIQDCIGDTVAKAVSEAQNGSVRLTALSHTCPVRATYEALLLVSGGGTGIRSCSVSHALALPRCAHVNGCMCSCCTQGYSDESHYHVSITRQAVA